MIFQFGAEHLPDGVMHSAVPLWLLLCWACSVCCSAQEVDEALEIWPAAVGTTLAVVREHDHLAVTDPHGSEGAAVRAEYRWSGDWPSTAADITLDTGLRRLHLIGASSGLLLRVEAELTECMAGPGALFSQALRKTICVALVEALGLTDEPGERPTGDLLMSCTQLGLDALTRVPAGVATEHTTGRGGGILAPDFNLDAYRARGPIVVPSAWPGRAAESCVGIARFPRLSLPGGGLGFFGITVGASRTDKLGAARELMHTQQQKWWSSLSTAPVFNATGTALGDWSLTLVREARANSVGAGIAAIPGAMHWSLRLTERSVSSPSQQFHIIRSPNDDRDVVVSAAGDRHQRGGSRFSVAASWKSAGASEYISDMRKDTHLLNDRTSDMQGHSQLHELVPWVDYDRRTLEPLLTGSVADRTNNRLCISPTETAGWSDSKAPCIPAAGRWTTDQSSPVPPEDSNRNLPMTNGRNGYLAVSVQMRRSMTQGDQMGFHRTLTTVLESPAVFRPPAADASALRQKHREHEEDQPPERSIYKQTASTHLSQPGPRQSCVLALVETLGEESFIDPYEVEDLLAYQRSQPPAPSHQHQAHRLRGVVLFDAVDLEKPADSPFTTQITLISWTTVTLPAIDQDNKGPWVRFDMPIHMRYLPPMQHNTGIANSTSDGYTKVSIPPPVVTINCDLRHSTADIGRQGPPETRHGGEQGELGSNSVRATDSHAWLQGSGWNPVTVLYTEESLGVGNEPGVEDGAGSGVVSANIPTGQLAHAAVVWYGTLAATLFAALGIVTTSQT